MKYKKKDCLDEIHQLFDEVNKDCVYNENEDVIEYVTLITVKRDGEWSTKKVIICILNNEIEFSNLMYERTKKFEYMFYPDISSFVHHCCIAQFGLKINGIVLRRVKDCTIKNSIYREI